MSIVRDVSDVLEGIGLENPDLPFLSTDPAFIRVLMFQPQGVFLADADGVRVEDSELMTAQMSAFLHKAVEFKSDLVACPEYSCTWRAIANSVKAGIFPESGKLWVLGCEGITPAKLKAVIAELSDHCRVLFEWPAASVSGNFLDCVCYLFSTRLTKGETTGVLLIQAKTNQMGGDPYEYEHLIVGNSIYRFGRAGANRLVSLLCSDTLSTNFGRDVTPQLLADTLLLHLQLNNNASSPGYREYRERCCTRKPRTTEILCLNWAKGTVYKHGTKMDDFVIEPKTILFRGLEDLDTSDDAIIMNHRKGCFFTYWETHRTAAFVFAPDAQLFRFQTTKPLVIGVGTNANRTGPRMTDRLEWTHDAKWESAQSDADDRFGAYWIRSRPLLHKLLAPYANKFLEVERLIQLCVGRGIDKDWAHWKTLPSFRFQSDDTACRLRLCWSDRGEGYRFRDDCSRDFDGFAAAVGDPNGFSTRLSAFKTREFTVEYRATPSYQHHRNLHIDEGPSATAVFVGFSPDPIRLQRTKKGLMAQLADVAQDVQMLAIWYRDAHGSLHDYMSDDIPTFTCDPKKNPVGIGNPDP